MTPRELLGLPWANWRTNLSVVRDYVGAYYGGLVPILFVVYLGLAWRRKARAELVLAAMCVAGGVVEIFLLRGFNEYLFNTAVIVTLLPLLARTSVLIWEGSGRNVSVRFWRPVGLALTALLLAPWVYQIVLMGTAPGNYLRRSTPWAAANYLDSWSTGFGVKEVVALLEKEKRPGVILADRQWGNPRTALKVYAEQFPNLRIVPVSSQMFERDQVRSFKEVAQRNFAVRYAIFSADASGDRPRWTQNLERELCDERTEIRAVPGQMPIVVCRF